MLQISFQITIIRFIDTISYCHSNFYEIVIELFGHICQFISDEAIKYQFCLSCVFTNSVRSFTIGICSWLLFENGQHTYSVRKSIVQLSTQLQFDVTIAFFSYDVKILIMRQKVHVHARRLISTYPYLYFVVTIQKSHPSCN